VKVLIIGSGGREHALSLKISQSPLIKELFCAPGNPGIFSSLKDLKRVDIETHEIEKLLKFSLDKQIDLTIVGPEVPLSLGIVDLFLANGLKIVGPTKNASKLESSKSFAKNIMEKGRVPTASFKSFFKVSEALDFIKDSDQNCFVVKCDGLAQGKGVVVCQTKNEAYKAVKDFMSEAVLGFIVDHLIIEEMLVGLEFSAFALCDGLDFVFLGSACDHKRLRDDDHGPNTGGMGAYAPANFLSLDDIEKIKETIFKPMLGAMNNEGTPFSGILFAGLMKTNQGFRVIEFNVRLGDPETQVILPLFEDDLLPWFFASSEGKISELKNQSKSPLKMMNMKALHVVMTSFGYPGTEGVKIRLGDELTFDESFHLSPNDYLFFAGVKNKDEKFYSNGGRVLGVTSVAETYLHARARAYDYMSKIKLQDGHYRLDIGRGLS